MNVNGNQGPSACIQSLGRHLEEALTGCYDTVLLPDGIISSFHQRLKVSASNRASFPPLGAFFCYYVFVVFKTGKSDTLSNFMKDGWKEWVSVQLL